MPNQLAKIPAKTALGEEAYRDMVDSTFSKDRMRIMSRSSGDEDARGAPSLRDKSRKPFAAGILASWSASMAFFSIFGGEILNGF